MSGKLPASALAALVLFCSGAVFCAEQFGTAAQARAMLERAVAALKADPAKALKQFNDENNKQFRDRDLYVFCFNVADGKFTAYQSDLLLGADIRDFKLQDDPVGRRAYDAVAKAPEGSVVTVEYNMPKPGTKNPVPKESLETRIGNQACGVGYYK